MYRSIYEQILYGDYYCYHYMNCISNYDYEVLHFNIHHGFVFTQTLKDFSFPILRFSKND